MNKKSLVVAMCAGLYLTPCLAEITTDGTVGRATHLEGPHFKIGQDLGTLKGNNLFHSFDHFNLSKGQSATFTGNSAIKNVISRVTGGDASKIDGTLRSTIGKANFYFINPAGVVFGKNANVNVPAAFYTSTAGELKFADGGKFSALHPNAKLSMAAPEAFGFLGKQTGTIAVNGSHLEFKNSAVVQLSANKIRMDNAAISGKEMDLQLAAVGAAKQAVGVNTLPNKALQGGITLNNTLLTTEGNGKGRIAIRGGQVSFTEGSTTVTNSGNKNMDLRQGINIYANDLNIKNSTIKSETVKGGNGGSITINAKSIEIYVKPKKNRYVDSEIISRAIYGKAGDINIIAQDKILIKGDGATGGIISDTDYYDGDTGNISIKSGTIIAHNSYGIRIINRNPSKNKIGNINITTKDKLIMKGSGVEIYSTENIIPGFININSGSILIIDSGIGNNVRNKIINGNIKIIVINDLIISGTGGIYSGEYANVSDSDDIYICSGTLRIDGYMAGIFSNSYLKESSGNIKIIVKDGLYILNGGVISSSTFGYGKAGDVVVKAKTININGSTNNYPYYFTGIESSTGREDIDDNKYSKGSVGKVIVTATKEILINRGAIKNSYNGNPSNSTAKANQIIINAPYVNINNKGQISAESNSSVSSSKIQINTQKLKLDNQSKINTTANEGDGGSITIKGLDRATAANWVHLHNSQITTSVTGKKGNGGNININADALVMDNGFIQANTNAKNATGGKIDLKNVKNLIASGGNLQIGGTKPLEFEPNSGNNIIQAAAPTGLSGNITNNAPQLNIVGALVNLKTTQPDLNRAGRDPCSSIVRQSTIKKGGKGGVPVFHKGRDGLAIDSLLDTPSPKQTQTTQPSHMAANQDCQPKHPHPQQHTLAHNAG